MTPQWIADNIPMPSNCTKLGRRDHLHDAGEPTRFWVLHCGHLTANYPWCVEEHLADEALFHGAHRYLAEARGTAERMYGGELVRAGDYLLTLTEAEEQGA